MTDIVTEVARIDAARDRPTLRLLREKWASFALSVFSLTFTSSAPSIKTERFHTRVEAYASEMRAQGYEAPETSGRDLCRGWIAREWLRRITEEEDEAYVLTSHALEALQVIASLSQGSSLISESRLRTIRSTVRDVALQASPDREARLSDLEEQIERLTAERDRLSAGGAMQEVTVDQLFEGYLNITGLLAQLPSDFQRLGESIAALRDRMIREFRADARPRGEVLEDFLRRLDHLLAETPEGRAFDGARQILLDDGHIRGLTEDLRRIIEHPFAQVLTPVERVEFLRADRVLRLGLEGVNVQIGRTARTLREHVQSADSRSERELDQTLMALEHEVREWMRTAGVRDRVPMDSMPSDTDYAYHHSDFWDPEAERPAPPLEEVEASEGVAALSVAQLRQQGGPLLDEVRASLANSLASGALSVSEAFNLMDDDLRRPVEVYGLLHLLAQTDAVRAEGYESVRTVRIDGDSVTVRIPSFAVDAQSLAEGENDE